MFKRGIKKAYLSHTSKQYKSNFTFNNGISMNTLTYKTPKFTLVYNGGEKMLVKCKLGNYSFVAKVRAFMKREWDERLHK